MQRQDKSWPTDSHIKNKNALLANLNNTKGPRLRTCSYLCSLRREADFDRHMICRCQCVIGIAFAEGGNPTCLGSFGQAAKRTVPIKIDARWMKC